MPYIGYKAKPFNLPSDTFFGTTVNTITGTSTPGTPPTGSAYVWFDSGLRKWRAKYDNGSIESLGVGTSGAAAHKDTHKAGGSDPFVKGDPLNAHARYLSTVGDPASDSQRFWLAAGGSEIRYWDDQGTPVKQVVATTSTAQVFSNKVLNNTCDISGAFSAANVAFTNVANNFIEPQLITKDANDLLYLYKPNNTAQTQMDLNFDFNNSTPTRTTFADIRARLVTNTAAAEDGSLEFNVIKAGNKHVMFKVYNDTIQFGDTNLRCVLDATGQTSAHTFTFPDATTQLAGISTANIFTAGQNISVEGSSDVLDLLRTDGTVGDTVDLDFQLQDSLGNTTTYATIQGEITDNTDPTEDGRLDFLIRDEGTLTNRLRIGDNGLTEIFGASTATDVLRLDRDTAGAGNAVAMLFRLNDALANSTDYGGIRVEIVDDTDASEDGKMIFKLLNAGSMADRAIINTDGSVEHILNSGGADALWLKRPRNTNADNVKINFQHHDSTSAYHTYAVIQSEIIDNTNGSEDGRLEFLTSENGTVSDVMLLHNNGDVDITRGALDILDDGNADLLDLERSDNGVGNQNGINFWLEDSTNALTKYGRIHTEIQDATNGSEDGEINLGLMRAGTFRDDVFRFDQGGYFYMKRYSSTDFDEIGIIFNALDNGSAEQQYGAISMEFMDTVAGSEDGQLDFDVVRAGTIQRVMKLDNVGGLRIGRDTSNMRGVVSAYNTSTTNQFFSNTTAEQTMFSYTVKANTVGVDGQITVKMAGYLHQDQATGTTFTVRVKVGGTTWFSDAFGGTIAQSSNSRVWRCELCFYPDNQSSTNGRLDGYFMMNDTTLPTTGIGSIGDDEVHVNAPIRSSGTNAWGSGFGTDTTISATVQMSVANANVMFEVEKVAIVLDPT